MNVFVLDENPRIAAQMQCDKHVVKMILETAQLLSTAHHVCDPTSEILPTLYKKTHENHPCAKWVREGQANYLWAWIHLAGLSEEYTRRYGKIHKTASLIPRLGVVPSGITNYGRTPFAQAMPDQYKSDDAVSAYQAYYIGEKHSIAKWKLGPPSWWPIIQGDDNGKTA